MLGDFAKVAEELEYRPPQIPILSTKSGETLSAEEATDPAYWVAQVREPVRFAPAIDTALTQGAETFLELGPDGVLCAMAASCLPPDSKAIAAPLLRDGRPEPEAALAALAKAHANGAELDWHAFFKGSGARAVPLPTYPFQRKRFWLEGSKASGDATRDRPAGDRVTRCSAPRQSSKTAAFCSAERSPSPPTPGWPTTPWETRSCSPAPPSWSWPSAPPRTAMPDRSKS